MIPQVLLDNPFRTAAALAALALVLAFVIGLANERVIDWLRRRVMASPQVAAMVPCALLLPYAVYAAGTGAFSFMALAKIVAYVALPVMLLWPDRLRRADRFGWRDGAAMVTLVLPIMARWMYGVFTWPVELYFFLPLTAVSIGGYVFLVLRGLDNAGFALLWQWRDVVNGLAHFAGFAAVALPLGTWLGFIHFHATPLTGSLLAKAVGMFVGIYLTIAIPEELFFRGILQNIFDKSLRRGTAALPLLLAAVIFGATHLINPPVPNWRYGILATLAGLFYGNAYRRDRRLPASALTHALVDTLWQLWF